jgi:hypothetical protein
MVIELGPYIVGEVRRDPWLRAQAATLSYLARRRRERT